MLREKNDKEIYNYIFNIFIFESQKNLHRYSIINNEKPKAKNIKYKTVNYIITIFYNIVTTKIINNT